MAKAQTLDVNVQNDQVHVGTAPNRYSLCVRRQLARLMLARLSRGKTSTSSVTSSVGWRETAEGTITAAQTCRPCRADVHLSNVTTHRRAAVVSEITILPPVGHAQPVVLPRCKPQELRVKSSDSARLTHGTLLGCKCVRTLTLLQSPAAFALSRKHRLWN